MPVETPNAFAAEFLHHMARQEPEPDTAAEADTAGSAQVVCRSGLGFAVLREDESLDEGDSPVALLQERSVALLLAVALPASGREPTYRLESQADAHGYPLYAHGRGVGHLARFDEGLVAALNAFDGLARSPRNLALVLEAIGGIALLRVGRILARLTGPRRSRRPDGGETPRP